ncbi:MAG: Heme O synthase, protoheme IX farnesyltransferase COX10-CtaB, partial [uncultured Corynebacteriales bacterium]
AVRPGPDRRPRRARGPPPPRRCRAAGVRGPHQAPDRRVAAGHDAAGDGAGRAGAAGARAGAGHADRRLARRGQRQRAQLLHRPGHRRGDAPHRRPPAGPARGHPAGRPGLRCRARRGRDRDHVGVHRLAAGAAHRVRDPVLRPGLHAGAQAPDPAEHRLGRRRRLHAGAHRLGRRHRVAGLGAGGDVRHRLLLDPAALLGAGDEVQGRLRPGRRADAPGGGQPADRGQADRRLHLAHRGHLPAAVAAGHLVDLRHGRGAVRGLVPRRRPPVAGPGPPRRAGAGAAAVPPVQLLPRGAVRGARRRRAGPL